MSDSVQPHRRQLTRLPRPWDSPGKNTGVGCYFLLQCLKVKSLSHLTLSDLMDCSPPGSSVHGIFQARVLEWGAIACWALKKHLFRGFPGCPGVRTRCFYCHERKESESEVAQLCPTLYSVNGIFQARVLERVAISFSRGSSLPKDRTQASCIAGTRFTI